MKKTDADGILESDEVILGDGGRGSGYQGTEEREQSLGSGHSRILPNLKWGHEPTVASILGTFGTAEAEVGIRPPDFGQGIHDGEEPL